MTGIYAGRQLRVPLSVWLISPVSARNITPLCGNVQWRSTVPGGFADCTVDLNQAFDEWSGDLRQFVILRVTDTRNGSICFEGRLEDPGRTSTDAGQVWQLNAFGPRVHATDDERPYVAIDRAAASRFVPAPHNNKYVDIGTDTFANPVAAGEPSAVKFDGLKLAAQAGISLPNFAIIGSALYTTLRESGQLLGSVDAAYGNGNLVNAFTRHYVTMEALIPSAPDGVVSTGIDAQFADPMVGSRAGSFVWRYGEDFNAIGPNHPQVFAIAWYRFASPAAAEVTGPEHWVVVGGPLVIRPVMHDKYGAQIPPSGTGQFATTFANSDQVFADLVGTRLPLWDPDTTEIVPSFSSSVDHFCYPDPTTVDKLLNDLMEKEIFPYYWAAWESYRRTVGGQVVFKARAEWKPWPNEVRHVIGMEDGCELPTSTEQVYDSVSVRWTDGNTGLVRNTVVEMQNDLLDAAGVHRRGSVDTGDNLVGDETGAILFGQSWLADRQFPRGSGTLTVARPVMDRATGRELAPWELRPGVLAQIAGADPSGYNQRAAARNGRNVFKVVTVEFDANRASAVLELDSVPRSMFDQLADANRNRIERRR